MTPIPPPEAAASTQQADLADLAAALTSLGCQANLCTPPPYLAIWQPGTEIAQQIYATGQHFYWATAEPIASRNDIGLAAGTIAWALRAHTQGHTHEPHQHPLPRSPATPASQHTRLRAGSPGQSS